MGLTPTLEGARALLKSGASLKEAAFKAGFATSSALDLALWEGMGRKEKDEATRPEPRQIGLPVGPAPEGRPSGNPKTRAMIKAAFEKRDAKIRSLLAEGYSLSAVAERFGLTTQHINEKVLAR